MGVVDQLAKAVVDLVEDLLADGVVSTGEVVGGIFLAVQDELRVEHLREQAGPHVIAHSGLQINGNVARNELTGAGLFEEGLEVQVSGIASERAIGVDAVLRRVLLPDSVADLDTGLADADGKDLTGGHFEVLKV